MPEVELSNEPKRVSDDPRFGAILLLFALVPGGYLLWEIQRTIGLGAPRFWTLLKTERVFDLAMLDFVLTASWAFFVLAERARRKDVRFWVAMGVFMVIPSVGIALFLILGCGKGFTQGTQRTQEKSPES